MKYFGLLVCACIFFVKSYALDFQENNEQKKFNFNQEWLLCVGDIHGAAAMNYNDKSWQKISIPHLISDDQTSEIIWYRKHFRLPNNSKDKKVFLEFENILSNAIIYVNGRQIYQYNDCVSPIGLDITDAVRSNTNNVIAIRIDNIVKNQHQWPESPFKGIPRNINLYICNNVYQTLPLYNSLKTTGTYVYARKMDISNNKADIYIETEVKNESEITQLINLEVVIEDTKGNIISQFKGNKCSMEPSTTKILKASASVSGIQFWSWGYSQLYNVYTILKINGISVDIQKTCTGFRKTGFRHGMVYLNDRAIYLKGYAQNSYNDWADIGCAIPTWLSDYSNQMMVDGNANIVRWLYTTPSKQDIEACDRVGLMQIIPAGDSDEYSEPDEKQWQQRKNIMRDAIIYNRNNPSVIFYECGNWGISEHQMQEMLAIRNQYDPYGGRAIGGKEMYDCHVTEYGGCANNICRSSSIPLLCSKHILLAPNLSQDDYTMKNIQFFCQAYGNRPGQGKRINAGIINSSFSDTYTKEQRIRSFGKVDATRVPKDLYFANQCIWDGWINAENPHIYIPGHWNYENGTTKDVYVISSCPSVSLQLNGKDLSPSEKINEFTTIYRQLPWEKGTLEAIGFDNNNHECCRYKLSTSGSPKKLNINTLSSPDGIKADGTDIIIAEITVVDAQGFRCPIATDITCTVEGAGLLVNETNTFHTENGITRAMIRTTHTPGEIKILAQTTQMAMVSASVQSQEFTSKKGLAPYFSSENLPLYQKRGPTPITPSFHSTLRQVEIIDAISKTIDNSSNFSYDDNERSEWSNNGLLSSACITYELEKETVLNCIYIKLANSNNVSYPLIIKTENGNEIFYETPKENNYFCIPITDSKPTRFVTLYLKGFPQTQLAEKETATDLLGSLRIIEIEFYENDKN